MRFKCTGVGSLLFVRTLFIAHKVVILSPKIHFAGASALQRLPSELWDRIASFIPRYFLRAWLFVSPFHRDIALRHVFHTVDLYLGDDANWNRTLDIFDRVKIDPLFSQRIRALRIHWAYGDGDMLDVMLSECEDFCSRSSPVYSFIRNISDSTSRIQRSSRVRVDRVPRTTSRHGASSSEEPPQPYQTWTYVRFDHLSTRLGSLTSFFLFFSEDGTSTQSAYLDSLP